MFRERLLSTEPRLSVVPRGDVPASDLLFQFADGRMNFFIVLLIAHNRDAFSVELGWSTAGVWPARLVPMMSSVDHGVPEGRVRLHRLAAPGDRLDQWWEIVKQPALEDLDAWLREPLPERQAINNVAPLVDDAIGKLATVGARFFEEVARAHSVSDWPFYAVKVGAGGS